MAGICISVSNTSKTEERSCSISCSSCSQHTASIPCFNMAAVRFSWILSSSIKSTRMTFMGGMAADCLGAYGLSFSEDSHSGASLSARDLPTGYRGRTTVKQLPSPSVLCTSIVPSSKVTSFFTIDNPSPNPSSPCAPERRVNSWKMRSRSSDAIPFPVSAMAMVNFEES